MKNNKINYKLFNASDKKKSIKNPKWNWENSYIFSNFYTPKIPLIIENESWYNTEQYFQAQKFNKNSKEYLEYYNIIKNADSPAKVKMLGIQKPNTFRGSKWVVNKKTDKRLVNDMINKYKHLTIRDDWESVKVKIMVKALLYKFNQYSELKKILINDIKDNDYLVENSGPRDNFWGDGGDEGTGEKGKNILGKILTIMHHIFKYNTCDNMNSELKKKVRINKI